MIPIRFLAPNFVGLKVYDTGVCFGLGQPEKKAEIKEYKETGLPGVRATGLDLKCEWQGSIQMGSQLTPTNLRIHFPAFQHN